ncbi:MAG: hypothetical protein EKK37_13670 [Sphingobacteriales bacterium]|nr:MAG: hypothetical protein EKK37_13670 [Sphingobacteriales bacterium]
MLQNKALTSLMFLFFFNVCCKRQTAKKSLIENEDSLITNCYVTKPVKTDSKSDTLRAFDFGNKSIDDFITNIKDKTELKYDSVMDYVTNFDYQKRITVNFSCYDKLTNPESFGLLNIYFNSGFATWVKKKSSISFLQSYKKEIFNLGKVIVYEYRLNNVAEIEPHFMYILLKEQKEEDLRYAKDYSGYVLCSDGLSWKEFANNRGYIPLYIKMVRRNKEIYTPLYFDSERFIPIGHFRNNNWQE